MEVNNPHRFASVVMAAFLILGIISLMALATIKIRGAEDETDRDYRTGSEYDASDYQDEPEPVSFQTREFDGEGLPGESRGETETEKNC